MNMNELPEILKYVLPALIVFLTAFTMIYLFLRNEERRRKYEASAEKKESTMPLRLQAYERFILFLERISPEALVMRVSRSDASVSQTLNELIASVRTEFEHNLVQQVYISTKAWEQIKSAKNNTIKFFTEMAKDFRPGDNGMLLSKQILEEVVDSKNLPVTQAIEFLKKEARELF
jgi:hypothetical protein